MILLDPLARLVIGHRGASGAFPENTLLAFRQAVEAGAEAVELDVHVSADGVPHVIHDATVDRTTDGSGAVASLPARALESLDAGRGEPVPRLAAVLEELPRIPLIVDIKTPAAAEPVADIVDRMGARDRVVLGSFDNATVKQVRSRGFLTVVSPRRSRLHWLASRVPGLPITTPGDVFSVPDRSSGLTVVDRRFARAAARSATPVHVWTIDEPEQARRLWTSGACGIISNWPDRLVPVCNQIRGV